MFTIKNFGLAVLIAVTAVGWNSAQAQGRIRDSFPIVAGTKISYSSRFCTAGLVLQQTGLLRRVTAYQRALRFVLTSGHCGNLNDEVKVGGMNAGTVVWKSNQFDLELIRVEPTSTRSVHCSAPSTGVHCTVSHDFTPRAVGQVILGSLRTREDGPVPVTGTGSPRNTEVFCTSGATTGVLCTWTMQHPPGWLNPGLTNIPYQYAETSGPNVTMGDSGGPVVTPSGIIYGIIAQSGRAGTIRENVMRYVSIDHFWAVEHGYALAPAN